MDIITRGKIVTLTVPEIKLDNEIEYPSEWFLKNAGKKPNIAVASMSGSDQEIVQSIASTKNMTINQALIFLIKTIPAYFNARSSESWESYGRVIAGSSGELITPISLLDISDNGDIIPLPEKGPTIDEKGILKRLVDIVCIYRIARAKEAPGEYKAMVTEKVKKVLLDTPFEIKDLDTGFIEERLSWESDSRFKKIIAALDMFLHKVPDHLYAKLKVGMLGSRYRDCGSLSVLKDMGSYMGVPTAEAPYYYMDGRIAEELIRISKAGEELSKYDSYFPYFKDMGLSTKSPYSNSVNPAMYNMTHSVGALLMIQRSHHARLFSETNIAGTVSIAMILAYYKSESLNPELCVVKRGTGQEYLERRAKLEKELGTAADLSPEDIYAKMIEYNFKVPDHIKKELRTRMARVENLRDGTIGKYILTAL